MGTNINVYTVYGIKVPYDKAFSEAYNDYLSENLAKPNKIGAILDFMMGDYMILGPILYCSGDFRYMEDMNDYQETDPDHLHQMKNNYYWNFEKNFPDYIDLLGKGDGWKIINVIEYS